ncbi:MAG: phospholipase D-like domain-containing protein [Candidatus Acidiferrum sp.]
MSKHRKTAATGAMLDLWRPPKDAGDPVGCLTSTYTFAPGLFDEQCLARFLEIESEPNREDLAFLLERESRLGAVYAGVLADQTQAGVEHSYRWDVLPVRIRGGKQHAKLSLLVWDVYVRIIVASANLTEQGYRTNYEVAAPVDLSPKGGNLDALREALTFLRGLIRLVPGPADQSPAVLRAESFLTNVERRARRWTPDRRRQSVRQHLVFTMPAQGTEAPARSSLAEAIEECRARGGSPREVWIASPFFDRENETSQMAASLCKLMARGGRRDVCLCVPVLRDQPSKSWRISAPKALLTTPQRYNAEMYVEALPGEDPDKNQRPWHAKMIAFRAQEYSALMVGSSNFTSAGMGIGHRRNAEANLLTIVQHEDFAREAGVLEGVWPEMSQIPNPENAEWLGAEPEREEEEQASSPPVAPGFLAAIYRAGAPREVILHLEPNQLPSQWRVRSTGKDTPELLSSDAWQRAGRKSLVEIAWDAVEPPEKLLVQWDDNETFLPLNVEDGRKLPPPPQLEKMTADDMLGILAASDPGAAYRVWAKSQQSDSQKEDELDSAVPVDLDPLRRYDLHATFLHRVRRRACVLAQLRANLQRPVSGRQALEWRLRGLVGIEALAGRLVRNLADANGSIDEALLTLTDFLIVLREVDYQFSEGSLRKEEYDKVFLHFLNELTKGLHQTVGVYRDRISEDLWQFWERVVLRGRT